MRWALLLVAGCGFRGHGADPDATIATTDDADHDAAVTPVDAKVDPAIDAPFVSIDAAPQWVVIDQFDIPVTNGMTVMSTVTLAAGTTYHLRASGTYITDTGSGLEGDADFYDWAQPKDITNTGTNCDVGIGIDDATSDNAKEPDWGAYAQNHIYEIPFTGKGAKITANIHDGVYTNDTGGLHLEILQLQ